jgi:hypothetical protein
LWERDQFIYDPQAKISKQFCVEIDLSFDPFISEADEDLEYVPADGEDSDESADDELIESAEERAAIRDLVEDNAPNAEWRRIRVI